MALALRMRDVTVAYTGHVALADVRLDIRPGECVALLGANGSGKSTLLRAAAGTIPFRGTVDVHGRDPRDGTRRVAYVAQRDAVDWAFPITAFEVARLGRNPFRRRFWPYRRADRDAALDALERFGVRQLAGRPIASLSGGQAQRVFLARALAQDADVLLLDEPFSGLDPGSEQSLLEVIFDLHGEGRTLVVATHDLELARQDFGRAVCLNAGRVVADGPPNEVLQPDHLLATFFSRPHTH